MKACDQLGELNYSFSLNMSDAKTLMRDLGGIVFDGQKLIFTGTLVVISGYLPQLAGKNLLRTTSLRLTAVL